MQKQLGVGSPGTQAVYLPTIFTRKMPRSSDSMYSFYFMLENIWHHHFTWSGPNSQKIVNFVPIVGPRGPELNWNKFAIFCEFDPLQVDDDIICFLALKWGIHGTWAFWHFLSKNGGQKCSAWILKDPFYAYEGKRKMQYKRFHDDIMKHFT